MRHPVCKTLEHFIEVAVGGNIFGFWPGGGGVELVDLNLLGRKRGLGLEGFEFGVEEEVRELREGSGPRLGWAEEKRFRSGGGGGGREVEGENGGERFS